LTIHTQLYKVPSVLMRGGTSRGLIIKDSDLPRDSVKRDQVITKIYGSSENGQIDGVGGGTSLTSKLAIVGMTEKAECDIFYTFGQVDIQSKKVDYNVTCGNMAAAVGLFAAEEGLVVLREGITKVKIFNTNTNKMMEVEIPVKDGKVVQKGNFHISGVSGSGAKIMVNFLDSGGAITGDLLPTGNVIDYIKGKNTGSIAVSIIDIGNLLVFVRAKDFGIEGDELSAEINNNPLLMEQIEDIRVKCGKRIGLFGSHEIVTPETHALPKIVLVNEAKAYIDENGNKVGASELDIVGRYITMGKLHRAFAVSGAIGLGTACQIVGTIPNQLKKSTENNEVTIGHPTGTIGVNVEIAKDDSGYKLIKGGTGRTARRIMEGSAIVPAELMN